MIFSLARRTVALLFLSATSGLAQDAPPPTPVTVETVHAEDVTLTSTLPGRVVASAVAEVRPQVSGIIQERLFEEGADVKEGDLLYVIDDATYRADLAAAEAVVSQAEATVRSSKKDADRLEKLLARSAVSEQTYDTAISTRDTAEASLEQARAQLMLAQINLERTKLRAPISGVIGFSLTSPGALVAAGQTEALAVIRTLDTVHVDVTQSAADLIAWRSGRAFATLGDADRTVSLTLADGSTYPETGELTAAEPHVDESTGVVLLRMTFPNNDGLLLPGMYVQVEMPQGVAENAILAPQEGVSRDTRGQPTALVVNADNVVEMRQLKTSRTRGADWIVTEGLADGDRVIIAGLQKTGPGATVAPEQAEAAESDAQPDAAADETAATDAQ